MSLCYHLRVTELRRLLAYMRPYMGQMAAATVMLAVAGAMMTMVVATLKPMVNEVLLAKPAAVKSEATGKTDSLDALVNRLPIHEAKRWLHDRPMVKVPVKVSVVFSR